jgi:uncharacterized protein
VIVALLLGPAMARSEVTVADTGAYVVDRAEIVPEATETNLANWLRELEQKTTAQVKVLTVKTTDGEDFFGFAQRHFDLWKLGQKGKDNGALIVLAIEERQVRIHTGYGLEGALPDSWCGTLSRQIASQYFKRGAYGAGIERMTIAVVNKVADEYGVQIRGVPAFRVQDKRGGDAMSVVCIFVLVALVLMAVLGSSNRRNRGRRGGWFFPMGPSVFGGSGGGGFGGGIGRGFGGGGGGFGGSFGGGGRSGGGGGGAGW